MRNRIVRRALMAAPLVLPLLACSIGGGGSSSTGTGTPTAATCATHATTTGEAWTVGQQIMGEVGGGAVGQLSNFPSALGLPSETDSGNLAWYVGSIAWAPDGRHLAVDVYLPVPDSNAQTYPYVVDTSTHAVTRINVPTDTTNDALRNLAWADNNTLLVLTGDTPGQPNIPMPAALYSYNVTSAALTTLPGVTHMTTDGAVRCGTLFYMEVTSFTNIGVDFNGANEFKGTALIHRYNLATHADVGSPITISDTFNADGSFGFYMVPGWDVSPDGSKIVYQHMAVHLSTSQSDYSIVSTFSAANADGSGAVAIFGGPNRVTAYNGVDLSISHNGAYVAVTDAFPTPDVATDSITGGSLRYYTPDAFNLAAWLPDSSGFDAVFDTSSGEGIQRYLLSTPLNGAGRAPGAVQVPSGASPATLG